MKSSDKPIGAEGETLPRISPRKLLMAAKSDDVETRQHVETTRFVEYERCGGGRQIIRKRIGAE